MINLRNEPEILPCDRDKPQILTSNNHVENMFLAVGYASRCWKEKNGEGAFDEAQALRIANELCAYVRLISTPVNSLEYLEWKSERKEKENKKCQ